MASTLKMSKKRRFVSEGMFNAELNAFLEKQLAEQGYAGMEVRALTGVTEVRIRATRPQNITGENGRRIMELSALVEKRFQYPKDSIKLYAAKVSNRGLCATAQAESLRFKLVEGVAVRRACYGVLRFVMESGAKGCEVAVSGKLRAQRAKTMKFTDGYMLSSGEPVKDYVDTAYRHVPLRQGMLGIKVKIMLPHDPKGEVGPSKPLPDAVIVLPPKEENLHDAAPRMHQLGASV